MAHTGSITFSDRNKMQKLYNQRGPAAFGSINNLTKASGISRVKVTEFLQLKDSYTKYKGIRRKFPRLIAHARSIDTRFGAWILLKWINYHDRTEVSTFYSLL